MSAAQPGEAVSRPVPGGLPRTFSSNNPFRNRPSPPNLSPGLPSPIEAPPRPLSRNPFLDLSPSSNPQSPFSTSPRKMSFPTDAASPPPAPLVGNAAVLFDNLTLDDKPSSSNGVRSQPTRSSTNDALPPPYTSVASNRGENVRPRPRAPPTHRPSRSQDEAKNGLRPVTSGGSGAGSSSRARPTAELDIFADPVESSSRRSRTRRNSESSVLERNDKPLDPEEEKRRQERRRRERRHREKGKDGRPLKPSRKMDLIDKLDVTSIYGTGLFHHDGPFDACNPNRNRNGSRRAPMQAFPKDSLNNALGGGGPINKRPNHATFLGNNDDEAFKDYAGSSAFDPYTMQPKPKTEASIQSATTRIEPIHGEESLGLGTSTFLEGAPASKTAMQRRESEGGAGDGGLGRKMSLAQKIRGINTNRRDFGPGRVTSPDGIYSATAVSPPSRAAGGRRTSEASPYINENGNGGDGKTDGATFTEPIRRAPPSPGRPRERVDRRTSDGSADAEQPKPSGGFLSRVKSLKGGPRKPKDMRPLPETTD